MSDGGYSEGLPQYIERVEHCQEFNVDLTLKVDNTAKAYDNKLCMLSVVKNDNIALTHQMVDNIQANLTLVQKLITASAQLAIKQTKKDNLI